MDHAEAVAKRLFESVFVGSHMNYRDSQSKGEYDFDLCYADGCISVMEVTSAVDEVVELTNAAILDKKKGGSAIKTKLCKKDWYITPARGANIKRIRADSDRYLASIESEGRETFFGPTNCDSLSVERIYLDLHVISGAVIRWKEPGYIRIAPPGGGGPVGASIVINAVKREAWKDDNRRKLSTAGTQERHLAVYVYLTNYLPWCALVDFEPPLDLPQLPPEITDIWAFSESRSEHEYVVWRAALFSPWRRLGRVVLDNNAVRSSMPIA